MDSLPPCEICQHRFTEKGPIPYLLSCLHPVCETCVNSTKEQISCASCCSDVKHGVRQKDTVRLQQIFHLTAKDHPSDLLCTQGNDQNLAICWCQECQNLLCGKCQIKHKRQDGRNHTVRVIQSADPGNLEDVQHCHNHKDFPLDLWDKTCHYLICAGCRQSDHGNHEYEDVDVAAAAAKTDIEELQMKIVSIDLAHNSDVVKENLRSTFAAPTKAKIEDLRKKVESVCLSHNSDAVNCLSDNSDAANGFSHNSYGAKQDPREKISESKRMLIKNYIDSVLLYSTKYDLLTQRKVIVEPVEIFLASASKEGSRPPVSNTEGLESLRGTSSLGEVSALKQEISSMTQPKNPRRIVQYDRDFLMKLRYSKASTTRCNSFQLVPEITPTASTMKQHLSSRSRFKKQS